MPESLPGLRHRFFRERSMVPVPGTGIGSFPVVPAATRNEGGFFYCTLFPEGVEALRGKMPCPVLPCIRACGAEMEPAGRYTVRHASDPDGQFAHIPGECEETQIPENMLVSIGPLFRDPCPAAGGTLLETGSSTR